MEDRTSNAWQPAINTTGTQANLHATGRSDHPEGADRAAWYIGTAVAALICIWAIAIFVIKPARFAVLAPQAAVGVEAASALARLFGAVVLSLFPPNPTGQRLHWVAAGFGILGLGGLGFGFLQPLLFTTLDLNTSIYAALMVRSLAGALFVIGLVPGVSRPFSRWWFLMCTAVFAVFSLLLIQEAAILPILVQIDGLEAAVAEGDAPLRGLTAWHWILSLIPLTLACAAVWGAARHGQQGSLGRWLLVAMVLQAGSQLHTMFWPSVYSPVLTTADMLRLLFAAVVAIGGILELRRIAGEYAALLAIAQEHSRRLNELSRLKADFTAMVAHELSSPIAAIHGLADMLATGSLDAETQQQTIATIQSETDTLKMLVVDVQTAAQVEREDFTLRLQPVPLKKLIEDAAAFAKTLPGTHPINVHNPTSVLVRADRERIGQVLRNLLSNAAKYSPISTPIEIHVTDNAGRVRIEVIDRGYGIHPEDRVRIFEKFGRGRDQDGHKVPGVGLGLYLSQRIVRAHNTELTVQSVLGEGSRFAFELEVAP